MPPAGILGISFELTNTGTCSGTEVVQLYIRDLHASCVRSVKELAGFGKVLLEPGAKCRISFRLDMTQTAFIDRNMDWKVEQGQMEVLVGSSSEDIRLSGRFNIAGNLMVDGKSRAFCAECSRHTV